MSVFSKKQRSQFNELKKSNPIVKFFDDIYTHNKAEALSKKASSTFHLKKGETLKITKNNFGQILCSISCLVLSKHVPCNSFISSITNLLEERTETCAIFDSELLMRVSYKKDTVSLESLRIIEKEITNQLCRSKNSLYIIIFKLWYEYMSNQYSKENFNSTHEAKIHFKKDITVFGEFVSNIIYNLFFDWTFLLEKNMDFYNRLVEEFVPNLITQHRSWLPIYRKILECFGEKPLKHISIQNAQKVIFIQPQFNYEGVKEPFQSCVQLMRQLYDQCIPKRKILLLKELIQTVRREIKNYQTMRITEGKMRQYIQVDADNILGIYAFCILKCDRIGVGQSLQYLQLFYANAKGQTKHLQNNGIEHSIASITSAARYLHLQDDNTKFL